MPSSRLRALGLLPLLLGAGSCREVPTAQILVVVSTNVDMNRIAYVRVQVESPDGTIQNQRVYDIQPTGQVRFPFSLGVLPRDSDTSRRVRIVAQAFNREDRPFITRSALCGFIPDTVVRLPMFLPDRCSNVTCARALTCNDNGECVDDQVDTSRLERNPPTGGAELDRSVSVPYADATVRDAVTPDAPDDAVTPDAPDATVTPDAPDATVTPDAPDATVIPDALDASPDRAPTDAPAAEAGTYLAIPANCAYPAATNTPRTPLPATSPRLVSPLSLGQVTSLRPTLRWARPSGVDMVRVELCADRACGTVITSFTANADAQAVPAALPPGRVVFWRVTPTVGGTPSAVWYFRTPRTDLGVDTSWGAQSDFNGDGFADVTLLVSAPLFGPLRFETAIFHGGPSGVCDIPQSGSQVVALTADGITEIAANGDFDGDGFGDLAFSATAPGRAGQVTVRWGRPSGLTAVGEQILRAPAGDVIFGQRVRAVGDVNRDGYADLAVGIGQSASTSNSGGVRVYLGGPDGLQSSPALVLNGSADEGLGGDIVGGGADFDGDGFHDLVATRRGSGSFKLLRGSAMGLQPTIDPPAPDPMRQSTTTAVAAGDFNGDGRSDLVYLTGTNEPSTLAPGLLAVWRGGPTGLRMTADEVVRSPADADYRAAVKAGESSGDSRAEVLIFERRLSGMANVVQPVMFTGGSGGLTRSTVALDTSPVTALGPFLAFVGDTDGDGFGDFAINVAQVRAYGFGGYGLLRGGPTGWSTGAIRFVAFDDIFRNVGSSQRNQVCD